MDVNVVVLSFGLTSVDLSAVLEGLKADSRRLTTHKRRELMWNGYSRLIARVGSTPGEVYSLFTFTSGGDDDEGSINVTDLTQRQRGLLRSIDILGRKFRPPEDPISKAWAMAWTEAEAALVLADLMDAEPCVYVSPDGVFVATRFKRTMCRGAPSLKSLKDVEKLVEELAPDSPLKSVSFVAHDPPSLLSYNLILAGPSSLGGQLPINVGHIDSLSANDIYDYFLERRNMQFVSDANMLIARMLTDIGKKLVPVISASSKEDAQKAYTYGLMKKVYVHESMAKFVNRVKSDGKVEIVVIKGNVDTTTFGQYGNLVFEMFYRVDLATFG